MVQVRFPSLEAFPGTRLGGFACPNLTHPARHPSDRQDSVVRPPIGFERKNAVTEY